MYGGNLINNVGSSLKFVNIRKIVRCLYGRKHLATETILKEKMGRIEVEMR